MNGRSLNKKYFIPVIICLFLSVLFIRNSTLASLYTKKGLEICFLTIIPSLFPLMVISDALFEFGFFEIFNKIQGNLSKKLFGLSKSAFTAVLSGLFLGFPVGARALISLYDNGRISKEELNRSLGFSGIPSFAFLTNAVGATVFGSFRFGVFLYFSAIFAALVTGMIFKKGEPTEEKERIGNSYKKPVSKIITSAISSSASSTVILCAYVVFFSAVVGCLSSSNALDETKKALIGSFLELSTGTLNSGDVGGTLGAVICGACVGWSGLSVHFQTMSLCEDRLLGYKTYLSEKAMQAVICGALSFVYALLIGFSKSSPADISTFSKIYKVEYTALIIVIFVFSFIYKTKGSMLKNRK